MFFGQAYHDRHQKLAKAIIDTYGQQWFFGKKLLDLGSGSGEIANSIYRHGAECTVIDVRQEHLKLIDRKFSKGIKTVSADLNNIFPFFNKKFDIILDLGLICHLNSFEKHLREIIPSTTFLILETAVSDSFDPNYCPKVAEPKAYDLSLHGSGCRPSPACIERVLTDCGMEFKRIISSKYNSGDYTYDWAPQNDSSTSLNKRAIWFCQKKPEQVEWENNAPTAIPIQFTKQPVSIPVNQTIQNSGIAPMKAPIKTHASPRAPMHAQITAQQASRSQDAITTTFRHMEGDKKFVIVIPSYKNSQWCIKNINSALGQNYSQYRIIFVDDCSPDNTFAKVSEIVANSLKKDIVSISRNTERKGALHNLYDMIHSCADDEIILTLDGDDWLFNADVLNKLNGVYANDVWITYGQYQNSTDGAIGISRAIPMHVINNNSFRQAPWSASHLRTFYAWLFKKIRKEDLMHGGKFYSMSWDLMIMFPMLEMAGDHSQFIPDILYVYNMENPINDHKVNVKLQQQLDREVRQKLRYPRAQRENVLTDFQSSLPWVPPSIQTNKKVPIHMTKIGLMIIATGKYDRFVQDLISTADQFFMKGSSNITYYLFSDKSIPVRTHRRVINIGVEHKPWPHSTSQRFRFFTNAASILSAEQYLYYVDVDCKFVDRVDAEIIGDLCGVQHCGFTKTIGPFEDNPQSMAYIPPAGRGTYFGGGWSGGAREHYLRLASWCADALDKDTSNNIVAKWNDESYINKYFSEHIPNIILSPSYHFPASNNAYYRKLWMPNTYQPKILLLDKDHNELRS